MIVIFFFFFKQKTAYEMRISDWSSDVCSFRSAFGEGLRCDIPARDDRLCGPAADGAGEREPVRRRPWRAQRRAAQPAQRLPRPGLGDPCRHGRAADSQAAQGELLPGRSEEHTSELQSLMRISYAVSCLKK